ncbi:ASCH domain-containing protein [Pseudoduganella sp. FT55W]|uniref:ASCH domain-containing protein n=1 Tax=Duganella rivi TaxID=2666083 RepID=A0A7X4KEN7_9BURK|nr:ASCH domain-containing protein [Duganella rivi]MYM70237.1 ASCH domain-containing protein [Duganella rivi]
MKKRVLLSIHPEYAEAILSGHKEFEFRKVLFKEKVSEVVIYATAPVSRVIGSFEVEDIYSASPNEIWERSKDFSGVSRELFNNYFHGRNLAHAIKIAKPVRFSRPKLLSHYLKSNVPPQSFCYI